MSSTIERRAQRAIAETTRRRAEAVVRLAEVVARHEMAGDLIQAAVFAELLLEAQERVREDITHVRVGDHTPEPRHAKYGPNKVIEPEYEPYQPLIGGSI